PPGYPDCGRWRAGMPDPSSRAAKRARGPSKEMLLGVVADSHDQVQASRAPAPCPGSASGALTSPSLRATASPPSRTTAEQRRSASGFAGRTRPAPGATTSRTQPHDLPGEQAAQFGDRLGAGGVVAVLGELHGTPEGYLRAGGDRAVVTLHPE